MNSNKGKKKRDTRPEVQVKKAKKNANGATGGDTSLERLIRDDLWKDGHKTKINKSVAFSEPYEVSLIDNLLANNNFVETLRRDITENIELHEKNNDLYKFKQSKDIREEITEGKTDTIEKFINIINHHVRPAIEKDIGQELDAQFTDLTVSRYDCGDYLLCHNDDIKGSKYHRRVVAFVYYLIDRDFTQEDGGSLQLFSSVSRGADCCSYPTSIKNRLYPKSNSLIYFNTTEDSWHAVEEVKRPDGCRLSINGWFTGTEKKVFKHKWNAIDPLPIMAPIKDEADMEKLFLTWINHEYMMKKTWKRVNKQFCDSSEINLTDFLAKDKYDELSGALAKSVKNDMKKWNLVGPMNVNHYRRADVESLQKICQELVTIFRSNLFFLMLSKLTGLELENDSSDNQDYESKPKCRCEFRSWKKGYYTMVHDYSEEMQESKVLDCILHFNHDFGVDFNSGGHITYIAKGEDEELLTIEPKSNCLSLVYRDPETARFVKYLSNQHQGDYQDLSCVYYPKHSDDSSSDSASD